MACSVCGEEGHNSRNCPKHSDNTVRDYAVTVRLDNLTKNEADKFSREIIKDKDKIAPDGRGTIVKGKQKQLPYQPAKPLKPQED